MIRCSHCGKLVPAGATSCQSCGMPLTTASSGTGIAGQGQTEQSELPAWLESLRAHERPVANNSGTSPFTMAELVDENSTPSWMRQDQSRLAETGSSDAMPAVPSRENPVASGNSLEASSLIDQQSLPSWMREAQESGPQTAAQGFPASSLVQQDDLPPWMKNLAPAAEPQMPTASTDERYGLPAQPPTRVPATPPTNNVRMPQTPQPIEGSRVPQTPPSIEVNEQSLGQGFLANSLVDQQALPDWMKGAQAAGATSAPGPLSSGFAAGELIDQHALPKWMKEPQGNEHIHPASAMGGPVNGDGQRAGTDQGMQGGAGMPASMLVDKNALPTWMSQGEQGGSVLGTPANGMSAGSLIDLNAMPAWMKNTQQAQPPAGMPNTGPTRADSMRVPSRPRGEAPPQEQSSAAANMFSSMLGVAASAPLLPGQNPTPQPPQEVGQGPQPSQGQSQSSVWQALQQQPTVNQSSQAWQTLQQQPTVNQSSQAWQALQQQPTINQNSQAWQALQQQPAVNQNSQAWQALQQQQPAANQSSQAWQALQQQPTVNQSSQAWQALQQQPAANQNNQAWQTSNPSSAQGSWMGVTPSAPSPIPNGPLAGNQAGNLNNAPPYAGYGNGSEALKARAGQAALGGDGRQSGEAGNMKKKSLFEAIRDFFFH